MHLSLAHISAFLVTVWFSQAIETGLHGRLYIYFASYLATVLIDMDHLPVVMKNGLEGLLNTYGMVRYPLHRLLYYGVALFASAISFSLSSLFPVSLIPGVVFAALFLHMSWDLFEDIVIVKSKKWRKLWS